MEHKNLPWGFIRTFGVIVPMFRAISEMAYLWQIEHRLDDKKLKKISKLKANTI